MSRATKEVFLKTLVSGLKTRCPQWPIEDHFKIQWLGQPHNTWPEADIVIDIPGRRFVIDYDEDGNPGNNLTKYWPILHDPKTVPLTIIQIWKRRKETCESFARLTIWMGMRLMKIYPGTIHEFIERNSESAEVIAKRITYMITGREADEEE